MKPTPTPPVATAKPPAPAAAKPAPVVPKPQPAQTAAVTPKPVAAPTAAEAPPASTVPAGSGLLQIGSYKSAADADTAWRSYRAKHASLVGGLSPDVKQVDLGPKGTWYRLRIAAGSKADASALCTKLKADGGDCLLAK